MAWIMNLYVLYTSSYARDENFQENILLIRAHDIIICAHDIIIRYHEMIIRLHDKYSVRTK